MRIVILAAGYATRLHPMTLTRPKPLLTVAGKPMVDYVLDHLAPFDNISHVYVVTNDKFAGHFQNWADRYQESKPDLHFKIVNDGSTEDANKLGAIGDLLLVLEQEHIDDDILVVAGDNLFNKPLGEFVKFCLEKNAPVLGVHDVQTVEQARKYGVVGLDKTGRITKFEEKPENPPSTLIGIALYYYPKAVLPLIHQYMAEGNNPDQPGRLVQWIYPRTPFYARTVPGIWYDIGSKETLDEANRIFGQKR